jgi:ABC-type dipeptide/oligopeptide/nickel transport system permease component
MATSAEAVSTSGRRMQTRERIAGWFVLLVLTVACTVFWIGVPAGFLWVLGRLTDSGTTHFVVALIGIPMAMVVYSPLLFWLNGLYLRVTGVLDRFDEEEEEPEWRRRLRGPLEPILFVSLAIELTALCIWFFFIAEQPPRIII